MTTTNIRGQNSDIQKSLSLSLSLKRVYIKTENYCFSGNTAKSSNPEGDRWYGTAILPTV